MIQVNPSDTNPTIEGSENQNLLDTVQKTEVPCDRCSMPMFRMRAVYWCERCGYKTDCCGH